MPSTTTTNVTIGTLLDLIGPGAPLPLSDSDPSVFDSLLQSPATPPPPPSASSPTGTNQQSVPTYRTDDSAKWQDRPTPQYSADGKSGDQTSDPPQTRQNSSQNTAATAPEVSSDSKNQSSKSDSSTSDQHAQAAEAVVAESLAGLAAAAPVATPTATPGATSDASDSTETEHLDPKAAVAKPVVPGG